jgi:hypothetical protein
VVGGLTWADRSTMWGAGLKGGVALVTDSNGARKPILQRALLRELEAAAPVIPA